MSFIKMLSRLGNLKYFPLVLSLILIIPFTPLESPAAPSGPEALWAGGCSGDENYSFFSEHGV